MKRPGADDLRRMLARNHEVATRTLEPDFPLASFEALQDWQRARIERSFQDVISRDNYRPAAEFFLGELYGGLDFRERDEDMGRVMPLMVRFLPDGSLVTMAEAFELQAISLEFDMAMARHMEKASVTELDMDRYCETYRSCSDRPRRERQILLIRKLGYDLDELVHKRMVNYLVRLMRGPARAAGLGRLQDFLETGLQSFRAMEDPHWFIETVYEREWEAMQRMFAGDERPFGF
ncbi:MAG: hypothetical protein RQ826_01665 [Xanthomonadales bacterium]|nr:hypothetical protein [Xanthomonadales bacterium]